MEFLLKLSQFIKLVDKAKFHTNWTKILTQSYYSKI
jgi:hypothetical protein